MVCVQPTARAPMQGQTGRQKAKLFKKKLSRIEYRTCSRQVDCGLKQRLAPASRFRDLHLSTYNDSSGKAETIVAHAAHRVGSSERVADGQNFQHLPINARQRDSVCDNGGSFICSFSDTTLFPVK